MDELLRDVAQALDDWINTYAPDMCDPRHVAQARERISDGGGTLAYIADIRKRINEARAHLTRAQTEGKDAQRYRWLRDMADDSDGPGPYVWMCDHNGMPPDDMRSDAMLHGEALDAAIDAAIGVEK